MEPQTATTSAAQDAKSILNLQIDPAKITVDEIDRYENLMLGDGAQGRANDSSHSLTNDVKPTWQVFEGTNLAGPFDLKMHKPTNVISLNIDVQFKSHQAPQISNSSASQS